MSAAPPVHAAALTRSTERPSERAEDDDAEDADETPRSACDRDDAREKEFINLRVCIVIYEAILKIRKMTQQEKRRD